MRRSPCRSWRLPRRRMSQSQHSRSAAQAARAVCWRPASATAAPSPPPHRAPTATGCLISHYNLRAARFLPLLLPRFVLRIIECIPLAPAAMRGERRPDNRPRNYAARAMRHTRQVTPSCGGKRNPNCKFLITYIKSENNAKITMKELQKN